MTGDDENLPAVGLDKPWADGVSRELASISEVARADPHAYTTNKDLQARQLALIEQQIADRNADDKWQAEADADDPTKPILDELWGMKARQLTTSFHRLPDEIQSWMASELTWPVPSVQPASKEAVAAFTSHDIGWQLSRRWGAETASKVAIISARLNRVLSAMSEPEMIQAMDWFEARSDDEQKAMLRQLAG